MIQNAPELDVLLEGLFADAPAPGPMERKLPAPADEAAARDLLLTRLRLGSMTFQSRVVAITVAERVGVEGIVEALQAILGDRTLDPPSRSCALVLGSGGNAARRATLLNGLGEDDRALVEDASSALEIAMQMPGFELSAMFHGNLAHAPAGHRGGIFARLERCRALASYPALLAWCRSLADPSLELFHGRMAAAMMDEAREGTALAAEVLCRTAPDESTRLSFARVVASVEARAARSSLPPARDAGCVHRIDRPDGSAEMTVCVPHAERIWYVAHVAWGADGALTVPSVYITPGEPMFGVAGNGTINLSYHMQTMQQCLRDLRPKVQGLTVQEDAIPWNVVVALCLLDGLAAPPAGGTDT